MKQTRFKQLALALIYSLTTALLFGCGSTPPRTQPVASTDPDAFHKSMRSLPKVTNAEAGGYAVSLTDELYATLKDRSIIKVILLERYKEDATIKMLMDDDACFGPKGAIPRKECSAQVEKIGGLLSAYHQTTIQILGHTDNQGSKNKKIALSKQRAKAIYSSLTKQGLSSKRVEATGMGSSKPIYSNSSANGRQFNRRVEFVINIVKEPSTKTAAPSTATVPNKNDNAVTTVKPLIKATTS